MPVFKRHPYAKGCDEPQCITDARTSAQIFVGDFAGNEALQTWFLSQIAGCAGGFTGDSPYGFFGDATAITGTLTNDVITANGVYRLPLPGGTYNITAVGTFGGGTLTAQLWDGTSAATIAVTGNPMTSGASITFSKSGLIPSIQFTLAGATTPNIRIYIDTV